MKGVAIALIVFATYVGAACISFNIGETHGKTEGYDEGLNARCCEGEIRSCVFGPGIPGIQTCRMGGVWKYMKCEPDPRFRVQP